jgi:hypothetical protein
LKRRINAEAVQIVRYASEYGKCWGHDIFGTFCAIEHVSETRSLRKKFSTELARARATYEAVERENMRKRHGVSRERSSFEDDRRSVDDLFQSLAEYGED